MARNALTAMRYESQQGSQSPGLAYSGPATPAASSALSLLSHSFTPGAAGSAPCLAAQSPSAVEKPGPANN